jgi:ribulose bisphosphate carboxylase small subunit
MRHLKSIEEFKQVNEQLFGNDTRELTKGVLKIMDPKYGDADSKSDDTKGGTGTASNKAEVNIGNYGKFSEGASKSSPLAIVFGGIPVEGKQSGEYMYNHFNKAGDKLNLFIAVNSNVNGKASYDSLAKKLNQRSITPAKKILYLFSEGYKPGMELLKSVGADKFDKIYLVDIWMGNASASDFYTKLAKDNKGKVEYYYTSFGADNNSARNTISQTVNKSLANTKNDHMNTNNDALQSLMKYI